MEIIDKKLREFEEIDGILENEELYEGLENKELFSSEQLFKCILGINKTESQVFGYLIKNNDVSTSEIAKFLEMDRSSIQKAIQRLSELNLIDRKAMSMKEYSNAKHKAKIKKQGYIYVYSARDIDSIKLQFKEQLDRWYGSMLKYIENLENLCECCGIKFEPC